MYTCNWSLHSACVNFLRVAMETLITILLPCLLCFDLHVHIYLHLHVHIHVHVNSVNETRQSKQLHPKTTPFFSKEKMSCLGQDSNPQRPAC